MKAILILSGAILLSLSSCKKDDTHHSCYDETLVHQNACTQDCPGVCGCDGNHYCNECEANRRGIKVVSDQPCQ